MFCKSLRLINICWYFIFSSSLFVMPVFADSKEEPKMHPIDNYCVEYDISGAAAGTMKKCSCDYGRLISVSQSMLNTYTTERDRNELKFPNMPNVNKLNLPSKSISTIIKVEKGVVTITNGAKSKKIVKPTSYKDKVKDMAGLKDNEIAPFLLKRLQKFGFVETEKREVLGRECTVYSSEKDKSRKCITDEYVELHVENLGGAIRLYANKFYKTASDTCANMLK